METPRIEIPAIRTRKKGYKRCGGYLGYLSHLPENASLPRECLTCPKVVDCAMEMYES